MIGGIKLKELASVSFKTAYNIIKEGVEKMSELMEPKIVKVE